MTLKEVSQMVIIQYPNCNVLVKFSTEIDDNGVETSWWEVTVTPPHDVAVSVRTTSCNQILDYLASDFSARPGFHNP